MAGKNKKSNSSKINAEKLACKFLNKFPETENEFFGVIEGLGGVAYFERRLVNKGEIPHNHKTNKFISNLSAVQHFVAEKLYEKYNVISPQESPKRGDENAQPAPEGKIYYWDWYEKTKLSYYKEQHDNIICSGCVFSGGEKQMAHSGGGIPCNRINGSMNTLWFRFECDFEKENNHFFPNETLFEALEKKGGEKAIIAYETKKDELRKINFETIKHIDLPIRYKQ